MRTIAATHASRHLLGLLDAVAQDERFTITRAGRVVAELGPVAAALPTGALRRALVGLPPLDGDLEVDIASATQLLK
jgi:antitoxin (DNA-binding transcriptional repressor) of toxin-antitoxin stability system